MSSLAMKAENIPHNLGKEIKISSDERESEEEKEEQQIITRKANLLKWIKYIKKTLGKIYPLEMTLILQLLN